MPRDIRRKIILEKICCIWYGCAISSFNFIKMGILSIEQIAQGLGLTEKDVTEAKNTIDGQESGENDE